MIKAFIPTAAAVALTLGAASSLQAQSSPIENWVGTVNRQVGEVLVLPRLEQNGEATVTFRRGSDGTAQDVVAIAANRAVRLAALRTARSLRHLPPLPDGVAGDQRVTMRILIGETSDLRFQRRREQLLAGATAANRQFAQRTADSRLAMLKERR